MMFDSLHRLLQKNAPDEATAWLDDFLARQREEFNQRQLYYAFSGASRRFPREELAVSDAEAEELEAACAGFTVHGWSVDRLARVLLLTFLADQKSAEEFSEAFEALLLTADLREQVAIYSALPLLPDPQSLVPWARDGLRTNIVDVYDSIALENPFPAAQFEAAAWNQMILKVFFIHRPLYRVVGVEARANADLALSLSDLAHERWAAGRDVSPEMWRNCVGFQDERILADIRRVATLEGPGHKEAAALMLLANPDGALDDLKPALSAELQLAEKGMLTWDTLGRDLEAAVAS